jgi:hypothetical protein
MKIDFLTPEELRRILNEELDKRFGPMPSTSPMASIATAREGDLVDSKEACRILGCGDRTLQRYRDKGLFSVIYRGPHRCYYFRAEILDFRAANTRPSRESK